MAPLPRENVTRTPPLLCIGIKSPEVLLSHVLKRMDGYLATPVEKLAWTHSRTASSKSLATASPPAAPIHVDLQSLFDGLD